MVIMSEYILSIPIIFLLFLWDPTMVSRGSRPAQRDPSSLSRVAGPGRSEGVDKKNAWFLEGKEMK